MSSTFSTDDASASVLASIAVTVILTGFVAATYGFGFYLFAQLVPDMRRDLGLDYATVGIITAGAQCGFLLFAMLGGWLTPRIGGGQVVVGSALLCGLCLILLSVVKAVPAMAALLVVMGGAAASVYVPMIELVGRVVVYRHRGKVLGLLSSGTSYGVFLNSLLVPPFIAAGNWQGVWLTVGSLTLAITAVGAFTFWRLGLIQAPMRSTIRAGDTKVGTYRFLVPWVILIWLMTFLNGLSMMPFQTYLSPYLREELGFGTPFAAKVWATLGIIGMVAGFAVGWLSDRIGVRFSLVLSYACTAGAAIILILAPVGIMPMIAGVLFALAFYPVFGLVPAYVSKMTDGRTATQVFAVANVTLGVGGICGNFAGGILKNATGSFVQIYEAITLIALLLSIASLLLPNETRYQGGKRADARTDAQ